MSPFWRLWIGVATLFAGWFTSFGYSPGMPSWWPIAGLWAAAAWASYGLSVWVAGCLLLLGLFTDFMSEAPVGSWALAFLSAYGVALLAWDRAPPLAGFIAEIIAVVGGMIAAGFALALAGAVSGSVGFWRDGFFYDFLLTALLYPAARFVLTVAHEKEVRLR